MRKYRYHFNTLLPIAARQINDAQNLDVKTLIKTAGVPDSKGEMTRVVALWWWMLPVIGVPVWVGGIMALSLITTGGWIIYRAGLGAIH
jgi:phosphoribosylcarboxyaminoimidazole (NCAIR) mutase